MNDKDYKKLIKEYEKLNASKSDIYPLSYDDCIERYRRLLGDERYIDATNEKKIKLASVGGRTRQRCLGNSGRGK